MMKKIMIMLAFLMIVSGTASAAQLLTNPGFEAGNTSGWTKGYGDIFAVDANPREGNFGARNFWDGSMSQEAVVAPGGSYTISGSAFIPSGGDAGGWGSYIALDWLNASHTKISSAWSAGPDADARDTWHDYASGNLTAPSNAAYAKVSFGLWQSGAEPANPTDFDNFALNGQPIPEPASMLLLGSGLVGLIGFARKKRS